MFSKLITWTILLVCEHFATDSYSFIILSLKLLNFTLNDSHSYLTYFLSFSLGRLAIASDWCETISQAPHRFSKPFYVSSCWLFYRDAVYNYVQTFTSFYLAKSPKYDIFNKSDSCESLTNHITNTSNVSPCSCKFILIKPFVQNITSSGRNCHICQCLHSWSCLELTQGLANAKELTNCRITLVKGKYSVVTKAGPSWKSRFECKGNSPAFRCSPVTDMLNHILKCFSKAESKLLPCCHAVENPFRSRSTDSQNHIKHQMKGTILLEQTLFFFFFWIIFLETVLSCFYFKQSRLVVYHSLYIDIPISKREKKLLGNSNIFTRTLQELGTLHKISYFLLCL